MKWLDYRSIMSAFILFFGLIQMSQAAKIMLVSQTQGKEAEIDQNIQRYLVQKGQQVDIVDQAIDPQSIKNVDLVILSSTVASKSLKSGWRNIHYPLMTWENDYLDDLAMTGKRSGTDFGELEKERYLWLVNQPNELSAKLLAGTVNVYKKQAPMSWGKPGLGATIIATIYGQPEKVAIWGYEKDSTMDYETLAPARRLMFFLGNDTFDNLSEDGLKLFDASIAWMTKK